MEKAEIAGYFENGMLCLPDESVGFDKLPWVPHPVFEGVALKHLVRGDASGWRFSYHLVRIAPGKKIGMHVHEAQVETHEVLAGRGECLNDGVKMDYAPGIISIFAGNTPHEIAAGEKGLYLLAKFFPALC